MRRFPSLVWVGAALALMMALGGCTPGGQFDPTELLSTDVFNTKKAIAGDREPLFPNGVPGAETGVPPDLIKGYQPPPEQAAADSADTAAKPAPVAAKPKPKPKPKPVVAHVAPPPPAHDPAWDQKPASPPNPGQSPWPAAAVNAAQSDQLAVASARSTGANELAGAANRATPASGAACAAQLAESSRFALSRFVVKRRV